MLLSSFHQLFTLSFVIFKVMIGKKKHDSATLFSEASCQTVDHVFQSPTSELSRSERQLTSDQGLLVCSSGSVHT